MVTQALKVFPNVLITPALFALAFISADKEAKCAGDLPSAADSMTVRNAHAMAYDSDREQVLLFGGADDRRVLGSLWAWNGENWRMLSDSGPAPRTFPCLAYDGGRHRLVLYGGNRVLFGTENDKDTFQDDMWEWDGARWQEIKTTTPAARAEACMVYDLKRRRIVLFGGYRRAQEQNLRLGDTWEWNGSSWEEMEVSGPSPRNGAAMAYDPVRHLVILFGGNGPSAETWLWNGKNWSELKTNAVAGRFNPAMAFDETRQHLIRFGGWNGQTRLADNWILESTIWRQLEGVGPEARNHSAMVFDAKRQCLVLFGGHDGERVFGDTWEWNGSAWSRAAFHAPLLRKDNGH